MQITFKGNPMTLVGEPLKVGDKLPNFTLTKMDLTDLSAEETKGVRIFLAVPSLDTPICDMEVARFNQELQKLPAVTCYTVSVDLPFAQSRWCQAKAVENVVVASDYKNRSFGKETGTFIEELCLLTRACFVVNEQNEVVFADYMPEVSSEPDYQAVLTAAKALL